MVKTHNYSMIQLSHKTNREENGGLERKKSDSSEETENSENKENSEESESNGEDVSGKKTDSSDVSEELNSEAQNAVDTLMNIMQDREQTGKPEDGQELQTETTAETESSETTNFGNRNLFPIVGAIIALILLFLGIILVVINKRKTGNGEVDPSYEKTGYPENYPDRASVKINKVPRSSPAIITTVHGVGSRPAQQDSFGISDVENPENITKKGILAIVADGMGGLEDGDRVSQLVVVKMLQGFDQATGDENPADLLLSLLDSANDAVNRELGSERQGQCGSTLVSVLVKKDKLYFISVGDSHIYLYRSGTLKQLNRDHNYAAELDEMVRNGEMSIEEAMTNPKRAALTSYIGMGDLELVDQNSNPILLKQHDRILLMSDGVYGTLGDENICHAMDVPLKESGQMINEMIRAENKQNQDNYTCILMEIT
ncbi:PP2C family protein-serine/threonine phosphatase [Butyrivibrio sp. MB2005]|uniref:PP2C family protein-serine/threonine phosphatase n=1 Tax=Butyrivibrio sp. MB2005 TaxID=1280678 RepID=UPI00047CD8CB|nr:PP2C family serine/threonine-protein phosphatase [Butyrivibrio sp. MB2005]